MKESNENMLLELFDNICNINKTENNTSEEFQISSEEILDFLFVSGGATRFIGLASSAIRLHELGFSPQVYGGISAGAILLVPLIMGKYEEIITIGGNLTPQQIFPVRPVNDDGDITWKAIWRIITKEYSLGIQDIKPIVRNVVTPELFKEYQCGDYPDAFVMAVDANTLRRKLWNLKDKSIDYEKYLKIISASSRIPIMTQAEYIDGVPYFDGGMRNHTPSTKVLQLYDNKNIGKVISLFSREETIDRPSTKWNNNVIEMIFRFIDCLSLEVSKRDEEMEKMLSIIKQFPLKQFYLDNILDSLYDTNPDSLEKLRLHGIDQINEGIGDFLK
jgi:predicted acylesterase/phospholipase RssA